MLELNPAQPLRRLDALAAEGRGLLRRAHRLRQGLAELEDQPVDAAAADLIDQLERLVEALEERRRRERAALKRSLRGEARKE